MCGFNEIVCHQNMKYGMMYRMKQLNIYFPKGHHSKPKAQGVPKVVPTYALIHYKTNLLALKYCDNRPF